MGEELRILNKSCGECTMCCKLLGIPEIQKKPGQWCPECNIGRGCKVYDTRPQPCRDFECLWLMNDAPEEYRPDRIKAVIGMTTDGETPVIYLDAATPDRWHEGLLGKMVEKLRADFPVIVVSGDRRKLLPRLGDTNPILEAAM